MPSLAFAASMEWRSPKTAMLANPCSTVSDAGRSTRRPSYERQATKVSAFSERVAQRLGYVVTLHIAYGLNGAITAEQLGVSRERVRQLLNKARAAGMFVPAKERLEKPRKRTREERLTIARDRDYKEYCDLAAALRYNPSATDLQVGLGREAHNLFGRIARHFGGFKKFLSWYAITPNYKPPGFCDPVVRAKINATLKARPHVVAGTCRRGHLRSTDGVTYTFSSGVVQHYCKTCAKIRYNAKKEQV